MKQDADKADWLIGAGLFKKKVKGGALRSMKEPGSAYDDPVIGKDPQPGHMKDYVKTTSDNGGVHINSGIPNRAFYLTAIELGGKAWEKAGMIWYVTLRDRLRENSTFQDAAKLTYSVAGNLFGKGSPEQKAVANGWAGVGLQIKSAKGSTQETGLVLFYTFIGEQFSAVPGTAYFINLIFLLFGMMSWTIDSLITIIGSTIF